MKVNRREVLAAFAQRPVRLVPRTDLVSTLEFEEQAKRVLPPDRFTLIAGGERAAFDRITIRPRMCVPVLDMDLGLRLLGDQHFAPILVGPVEDQRRFHADAEAATLRGAAAAKAVMVVSRRSSVPLKSLAADARTPLWAQVFAADAGAKAHILEAVASGCRAICLTVAAPIDWTVAGGLIAAARVPVVVKGVTTPAAASLAIRHGAQALIVSNQAMGRRRSGSLILSLPSVIDSVQGNVPVLVDGSFRRGTDIIKALALGARAVLVARPVMWGLAAYGDEGVQGVIEMLQTELARYMGMCGKSSLSSLDRSLVRIHGRA